MASELTVPSQLQFRKRLKRGLQILLNTFYDAMLLYTQNIQVVNFSDIDKGIVNVIITYTTEEGRSVKFEALGEVNSNYIHALDFIWQAMQRGSSGSTDWLLQPLCTFDPPYFQWFVKNITRAIIIKGLYNFVFKRLIYIKFIEYEADMPAEYKGLNNRSPYLEFI